MDHIEAIRLMAAEKYVLDELEPDTREAFEDHFFGCAECALDVRAGIAFREHCKLELAEPPSPVVVAERKAAGWLHWLRPAIAVPVMAVLLAVIGIQQLVVYPRLREQVATLETPEVLASASLVNVNTRGPERAVIRVHRDEPFLLFVDIPSVPQASSYRAELNDPDGNPQWSIVVPAEVTNDTVAIRAPLGPKTSGVYTLVVRTADASGVEVGRYPFELRLY